MLLAVVTLDRSDENVHEAANALAVALPLATAANVFYVFRRHVAFRIADRILLIATLGASMIALLITFFSIYYIFRYLAASSAERYQNTVGAAFLVLVVTVAADRALYERWAERRRRQKHLRDDDV